MANERHFLGLLLLLAGSAACKADSTSLAEPGAGGDLSGSIAGQTGDEGAKPWTPGGAINDSDCPLSTIAEPLASLEEQVELGFSATDILGVVVGSREARVHWN